MIKSIFFACFLFSFSYIIYADEKPSIIVLTDIGGDPDDTQSLRRLLVYSNEFNIKGLIATADNIPRPDYKHQIRTDLILEAIDDYAQVRDNLLLHDPSYPTAESLRAVVRGGEVNRGAENLAPGKGTPASQFIIETIDACKEPVYILIWGGAHDLAQALLDLKTTRSKQEVGWFIRKLKIYAISDQDAINKIHSGTGEWIRENFPDIWYIEPGSININGMTASYRGMYQNDSKGGEYPTLPLVKPGVEKLNQQEWIRENVTSLGPVGKGYPDDVNQNPGSDRNTKGVKEGDTPSWFFVYRNGLNDPDFPEWGGWGGRFEKKGATYYNEAEDDHWTGEKDVSLRRKWTVARWREAYQNDFAARMRWCVLPIEQANHNPVATIDNDTTTTVLIKRVKPGEILTIDASKTYDPDEDNLNFNWWVYKEISTPGIILKNNKAKQVELKIPKSNDKGQIHLILEVKDNGHPELLAYRRIVLEIE